jgi:hypothetical protein
MLDTIIRQGDQHVRVEQQPNDAADAARLYGELLAKARAEVSRQVAVEFSNALVVLAASTEINVVNDDRLVRVLFSLNGDKYDIHLTIDSMDVRSREDAVARVFCRAVAERITERLVALIGQPAFRCLAR